MSPRRQKIDYTGRHSFILGPPGLSSSPWEAYCYAYEDLDLKWYDGYEDQGVSSRDIKDFIRTLDIIDEVSLYLGDQKHHRQ